MSAPENPFAFPKTKSAVCPPSQNGMTLRDYFAGQALIGRALIVADEGYQLVTQSGHDLMAAVGMAASCYELADAMLAERAKGGAK